jgi:hypothetical protein
MPSVARLRELDSAATKAPWFHSTDAEIPRNEHGDIKWPDHLARNFPPHWDYYLQAADADLITGLRNALPAFLQVVDAARGLVNAWDEDTRSRARAELNNALQELETA